MCRLKGFLHEALLSGVLIFEPVGRDGSVRCMDPREAKGASCLNQSESETHGKDGKVTGGGGAGGMWPPQVVVHRVTPARRCGRVRLPERSPGARR